jgi:hypothetical protein
MWPLHNQSYCNISMKNGNNVITKQWKTNKIPDYRNNYTIKYKNGRRRQNRYPLHKPNGYGWCPYITDRIIKQVWDKLSKPRTLLDSEWVQIFELIDCCLTSCSWRLQLCKSIEQIHDAGTYMALELEWVNGQKA